MKQLSFILLFTFITTSAVAEYSVELEASLGFGELEYSDDFNATEYELDFKHLSGTAYIAPISVDGIPLGEAGFLSKTSSFSFSHTSRKRSRDSSFNSFEEHFSQVIFGGRWVLPGKSAFIGAAINQGEFDYDSETSYDRNRYTANIGAYLNANSALWLQYGNGDVERFSFENTKLDESELTINYKHVIDLSSGNHLNLEVMLGKFEEDFDIGYVDRQSLQLGLSYYFSPQLAFGADFRFDRYDNKEYNDTAGGKIFSPKLSYFVLDNVEVFVFFHSESIDVNEDESDFGGVDFEVSNDYQTIGVKVRI